MKINRIAIANNIKNIRQSFNMTQKEFAEKLNTDRKYLSELENSKRLPSIEMIYRICETFNLPLNAILYENLSAYHSPKNENEEFNKMLQCCSVNEMEYIIDLINMIN